MINPLRLLKAHALAAALVWFGLVAAADAQSLPGTVTLTSGTSVSVRPQLTVSANTDRSGEPVVFVTTEPLIINGVSVIPAESTARGTVVFARGAGMGHAAKLLVSIEAVQACDGSWIPLRATPTRHPGDQLLPASLLRHGHGGFLSGRDILLTADTVCPAYLDEGCAFSVTPASAPGLPPRLQALSPPAATAEGQATVRLSDGTPITVTPVKTLTSGQLKAGNQVDFTVAAPLLMGGVVMVEKGAPAHGTVLMSRHSKLLGQRGELAFCVDSVQAVDGSWLDVHATTNRNGGRMPMISPPGTPGYVGVIPQLFPGTNARLLKGQLVHVFVNGDHFYALRTTADAGKLQIIAVPNE